MDERILNFLLSHPSFSRFKRTYLDHNFSCHKLHVDNVCTQALSIASVAFELKTIPFTYPAHPFMLHVRNLSIDIQITRLYTKKENGVHH